MSDTAAILTPDARYIVVRGRLWRAANPWLGPECRQELVDELMSARRAVGRARKSKDVDAERAARFLVDRVKHELGERGPVWWTDGAPDYNRHMAVNTPYSNWFKGHADH